MFSRNKNNKPQGVAGTVPSIISADLKIKGNLTSTGEVQVDGEIEGDINANVLLIGESAKIKGQVFADTVRVHGRVNGQIKAKNVNLARTAHVVGDILHENLSIDEGAYLEGHMKHVAQDSVKPAVEASGATPAEDRVNLVVKTQPAAVQRPQQPGTQQPPKQALSGS